MGVKKNCWEVKGCGQQRRGSKNRLVKCPVPEMTSADGINGGKNAGRICWLIANTMCKGNGGSIFEEIIKTCGECDFYKLVKEEGGEAVTLSIETLREAYEGNKPDDSDPGQKKQNDPALEK